MTMAKTGVVPKVIILLILSLAVGLGCSGKRGDDGKEGDTGPAGKKIGQICDERFLDGTDVDHRAATSTIHIISSLFRVIPDDIAIGRNAKSVEAAVDIVEIADDLIGLENLAIVDTGFG